MDKNYKFIRFDENGKFLNQIGNRGAGPGEYRSISQGFMINSYSHEIFIPGGKDNQVMVYSPDGKYIRSFDFPTRILTRIGLNGKNMLAYFFNWAEYDTINMKLLDTNGTILKNYQNKYAFERGKINFQTECIMYQFENQLHFKEICSDTVFYMDGEKMVPEMILNSGERRLTPEIRTKINGEIVMGTANVGETINKVLIQSNLFESNNYIFYTYTYDDSRNYRTLVYNKSTGKKVEFNFMEGIINDWDGGPNIHPKMNER